MLKTRFKNKNHLLQTKKKKKKTESPNLTFELSQYNDRVLTKILIFHREVIVLPIFFAVELYKLWWARKV